MADRRSGIGWLPVVFAVAALGAGGSDTRLADAARAGDIGAVDVLLQAGTAVDAPGPDGTTALHWAVYRDDAEMAARLVAAGADVDRTNRNGTTPLSLACVNANPTMVQHLLEAGADPSLPASGEPPLLTCARTGRVEAVERLLARGADPNAADDWKGQTAVMWATAEDHVAVVETLVAHGADVNMAATPGETALFVAVQLGLDESVRALLAAGADVTVTSPGDAPLSHVAAAAGHHALGAELLEHGLDPNALDKRGQNALHAVVEARRLKHQSRRTRPGPESFAFMQRLIAHGADIDARMVVATPGYFDRPDKADRADKADKADEADDTETPADDADTSAVEPAETDDAEPSPAVVVGRLDGRTNLVGATPFLLAAKAADLDAMRLLLEHGADPLATTDGDNSALTLAAGVVFLEGGTGQFEGPPKSDVLEAVQLALELGCDVNTANSDGQTALHGAVYRAANDVIQFLVDAGARTDLEDAAGRTPLRLAEEGFNQFGSRIRRDNAAVLLREIDGRVRPQAQP